jgi:hypothetical protein
MMGCQSITISPLFKKLQRSEKCGVQKGTDEELGQFKHPVWQMLIEPIVANQ